MKAFQRNIRLLYFFRFIGSFLVVIPILVPFFVEVGGLNQTQIFTLQSVYALLIVLLEVPSGYFADRFGRKRSLLIGSIVGALGLMIYSLASGFYPFLFAEALLGVGASFISGADTAMAYDSFLEMNRKDDYLKFEARASAYGGMAEGLASLLGGLLVLVSLRFPVLVQVFIYSSLIPMALLLKETKHTKPSTEHIFKKVLDVTKYALHGHKEIKWLILYGAVLGTLTHTMVWLTQPYYELVGVPLKWFGLLWATQLFMMGVFAHWAEPYVNWLGRRKALISFPIIGVLSYLVLGFVPSLLVLPLILGFYFVRGLHFPVLQNYVNALVESDVRATVLSVKNLAQKLLYMLLGPLLGVLTDVYSLQTALLFSAALYGFLALIVLFSMNRLKVL